MISFCLSCGVKQPDRLGSAGAAPPLPAARLRVRGRGVTGCQPECRRSVGVPGPGPIVCRARHRGHDRPLNLTGILRLKLDSDVSSSFESAGRARARPRRSGPAAAASVASSACDHNRLESRLPGPHSPGFRRRMRPLRSHEPESPVAESLSRLDPRRRRPPPCRELSGSQCH
jgi:hypothetical protein